jgi:hypothetical protein
MGNTTKVGDLLCHSYVLPVSVTVQSVASHGVTLTDTGADPSFVWQAEDLAPGSREHITITDIVSPGLTADTRFTNTATIDGAEIDLNAFDNEDRAGVLVENPIRRAGWLSRARERVSQVVSGAEISS